MKKLNKIKFVSTLMALLFFATLTSCGKIDDQVNTSVTIKMPDLSNNNIAETVSAKMNSSVSTPTQLSDINCYAVMVGGPSGEPDLNRTRCEIVAVSGTAGATSTKVVVENRYVGMIRGLVPSNGTISLEVPSGADRVFSLVGLKASPATSCLGFTDPNINLDLISDPILLGTAKGVNLTGGVNNNVTIKMQSVSGSIANNYQIGECYGPDNPGNSKIVPTRAILTKNNFPSNILSAEQCNSIDVEFVDALGRTGDIPVSGVVRLSYDTRDISGNQATGGETYDIYDSFNSCSSGASPLDYVAIDEKTRSRQIWLKPASATAIAEYDFTPIITSSASSAVTILTGIEKTFSNQLSSNLALEIFGTQKVLPDTCYKMVANLKNLNNQSASSTSYRYKVEHPIVNGVPDVGASLYTSDQFGNLCLNSNLLTHNSVTSSPVNAGSNAFFFIKYSSGSTYRKTSFSLTPVVSSVSSTNLVKSTYQVEVVNGSRNPSRVAIMGQNQINGSATCPADRLFKAIIVNEKWTALPASSTIYLTSSLKSGSGSLFILNAEQNNPCPTSITSTTGSTSFMNNTYSMGFFVKTSATSATFTISATAVVSGPLGNSYTLPASTFDINVSP